MDNQAMIPDTPIISGEMGDTEEVNQEQLIEQAKAVASIVTTPGWKVLEGKLDDYIEQFRTGKFMGETEKLDLSTIGQKFVIASTVASICEDLKATITGAVSQVAEHERKRSQVK